MALFGIANEALDCTAIPLENRDAIRLLPPASHVVTLAEAVKGLVCHHGLTGREPGDIYHFTGHDPQTADILHEGIEEFAPEKCFPVWHLKYGPGTRCLPAEEAIRRAESRVGERNRYDLIKNNCESFVYWALLGKNIPSGQAEALLRKSEQSETMSRVIGFSALAAFLAESSGVADKELSMVGGSTAAVKVAGGSYAGARLGSLFGDTGTVVGGALGAFFGSLFGGATEEEATSSAAGVLNSGSSSVGKIVSSAMRGWHEAPPAEECKLGAEEADLPKSLPVPRRTTSSMHSLREGLLQVFARYGSGEKMGALFFAFGFLTLAADLSQFLAFNKRCSFLELSDANAVGIFQKVSPDMHPIGFPLFVKTIHLAALQQYGDNVDSAVLDKYLLTVIKAALR